MEERGLRIECGDGSYAVGAGNLDGKPCLTICSDGKGKVGGIFTREAPEIPHDIEVFTVSFKNIESVEVFLRVITELKEDFEGLKELRSASLSMRSLEIGAKKFATERHTGQVRKYTGEPYICHPAAVVEIVRGMTHTPEMIAAAWLHDTVEDTETTLGEIKEYFGDQVSVLVEMLTDVSEPGDGNRATRKALDREHTAKASPDAKTIKLADLIHNTKSIVEFDPDFAKIYLAEKELLLKVLKEGDKTLWNRANDIVRSTRCQSY